jgi:hypothetical protein
MLIFVERSNALRIMPNDVRLHAREMLLRCTLKPFHNQIYSSNTLLQSCQLLPVADIRSSRLRCRVHRTFCLGIGARNNL